MTRLFVSEITGKISRPFNGEGRHSRKTPPLILQCKKLNINIAVLNFRLMLATAANCRWFIFLFSTFWLIVFISSKVSPVNATRLY
jgi:hypothetical protein